MADSHSLLQGVVPSGKWDPVDLSWLPNSAALMPVGDMKFRERTFPRPPVNKPCRVRRTASYAIAIPFCRLDWLLRSSLWRWGLAARLARPWR